MNYWLPQYHYLITMPIIADGYQFYPIKSLDNAHKFSCWFIWLFDAIPWSRTIPHSFHPNNIVMIVIPTMTHTLYLYLQKLSTELAFVWWQRIDKGPC